MALRPYFLLALGAAAWASFASSAAAESVIVSKTTATAQSFTPSQEFQDLLTRLARDQLPDKYEKTKNWGKTVRVFDGWKFERDGMRLETRRRFKTANDGAWQKYGIRLVEPEKNFEIRVENLRQEESRVVCDVTILAAAQVWGRHTQWENGVQLASLSAEADARLRLRAKLEMALKLDVTKLPPDAYLQPRVTSADLDILEFKLRRVSHFDGPVVKSLSSSVREMLEDKIEDDRQKLVDKLNKSLAKQQAKLRFSPSDWLSAGDSDTESSKEVSHRDTKAQGRAQE
jgi:hypothetical protein